LIRTVCGPIDTTAAVGIVSRSWTGFADVEEPAAKLRAVKGSDGLVSLGLVRHLDERKTPRLSCIPICYDACAPNAPELLEQDPNLLFSYPKTNVSHIDIHRFSSLEMKGK
jgi:hypothetical protein